MRQGRFFINSKKSDVRKMGKRERGVILLISAAILLSVCICPSKAFALDNELLENELLWDGKGVTSLINNNGLDGKISYICDNENGCFYLHFHFFDSRLKSKRSDEIYINFVITNEKHSYAFSVGSAGVTGENSSYVGTNFEIGYNFDKMRLKASVGEIFIGIEFKNRDDRRQKNLIDAQCYYGGNFTTELLEKAEFDMTPVQTAVETTQKQTTVRQTTSGASGKNTVKGSTEKSSSAKEPGSGTTKFTPSKKVSEASQSTAQSSKFSPEKNTTRVQSSVSSGAENAVSESEPDSQAQTALQAQDGEENESRYSKPAKAGIAVASVCATAGVALIAAGAFSGRYKLVKKNDDEK